MNKFTLVFILLLCTIYVSGYAQRDTIVYFSPSGKVMSSSEKASEYILFAPNTNTDFLLVHYVKYKGKWKESFKEDVSKKNDSTFFIISRTGNNVNYYRTVFSKAMDNKVLIKHYFDNGKVSTGYSLMLFPEIKDGTWTYYKNGKKISEEYYSNNQMTGNISWNENGEEISRDVFARVDVMPDYNGGQEQLSRFLSNNLRYPVEASKIGVSGRVFIRFVVNEDGSVSNVEVLKGVHTSLDSEAVRVIKLMPKWYPGVLNGKTVRVQFTLPIAFKLGR